MTRFDPALVDFFKMGASGATVGVPFATYPSFLYYNKKLFDEAKLPYPPTKVGDLYEGKPWDMDAVRQLAMKLTVDNERQRRHQPRVRRQERRPVGLRHAVRRRTARLAEATLFGASSFLGSDGKTAQIPEQFDRPEVVQRRRLEGSLHPDAPADPERPARQGQ